MVVCALNLQVLALTSSNALRRDIEKLSGGCIQLLPFRVIFA